MENGIVVEWAPFQLVAGVDQATFLAASAALQADFLGQQPGFLRRELLKGTGDRWVDLVYWESQAAVDAAMQRVATSPVCLTYFQLMVPADQADPAAAMLFLDRIATYPASPSAVG